MNRRQREYIKRLEFMLKGLVDNGQAFDRLMHDLQDDIDADDERPFTETQEPSRACDELITYRIKDQWFVR